MKLKATDTMHISSVQAENLVKGDVFTVSDAEGKQLVDRGLATQVGKPAAKTAAAPSNKKAAAPSNKKAPAAKNK